MKKILIYFAMVVSLAACAVPYPEHAPALSFSYQPFKDQGVEISPYDAPSEGYVLLGDVLRVYGIEEMLSAMGVDRMSKSEMKWAQQAKYYTKYITEREIAVATAHGADAIFNFKVRPNTQSGAYENAITNSYVVSYIRARKVNSDGSYTNPKIEKYSPNFSKPTNKYIAPPTKQEEQETILSDYVKKGLKVDSTMCLAIIVNQDGSQVQCRLNPSKKQDNGYCHYHRSYAE